MKCSICGKEITRYGNSIYPLEGGRCCDECNMKVVMPVRVFIETTPKKNYALLIKENEVQLFQPGDKYFTLKELQEAVDGYIEVVQSEFDNYLDVVNEEGKLKKLYFNNIAYMLMNREYVGNVLVVPKAIFEKPEED